jgi:hypothetical protein
MDGLGLLFAGEEREREVTRWIGWVPPPRRRRRGGEGGCQVDGLGLLFAGEEKGREVARWVRSLQYR